MEELEYSLIANTGVQLLTQRIVIDPNDRFKEWFHEWHDEDDDNEKLNLVYEKTSDNGEKYFFNKVELLKGGYLADPENEPGVDFLSIHGIKPIMSGETFAPGYTGEIYPVSFDKELPLGKQRKLAPLEIFKNQWIPVPYFAKSGRRFEPLNWARMIMVPVKTEKGKLIYDIVLAFDTRTSTTREKYSECPVFDSPKEMDFALCVNDGLLVDYCLPGKPYSYIDERLFHIAHPTVKDIKQLYSLPKQKLGYAAAYIYIMSYFSKNKLLPKIKLYKDEGNYIDVDMVVDIGNSRTTALLLEDPYNAKFNKVRPLSLTNFTNLIRVDNDGKVSINSSNEPFDMRLAFRKVKFGDFGPDNSRQFVHPSFVRLGIEAMDLLRKATRRSGNETVLSTFSSPKRYLWDGRPNPEEWKFLVLPGENEKDHVFELQGVSDWLKSDGKFSADGVRGLSHHYSPRSLMTLAFLEMFAQAKVQINSFAHRTEFNDMDHRRRLKRIVVTCPTAMSKLEREALVNCARDAVKILYAYAGKREEGDKIEVVPTPVVRDEELRWYYDEATCSQLVYIFGEVGYKYKGNAREFFSLYGKIDEGDTKPSLTVGSLDIGAGTSDLMISKYTYSDEGITTIIPDPLFYDSFYFAGDDMLKDMILNIMLQNPDSSFRQTLKNMGDREYYQLMSDFFGRDNNQHTYADKMLRKDFNIQYSVPLMSYFLELIKNGEHDKTVTYDEVFGSAPPNESVIEGFKQRTGIDIRKISWNFNNAEVSSVIEKAMEPMLKKIATMMYSYACDIVILSGRPASLPVIKEIFLKFYAVTADRLIVLNNYYVGKWYPFSKNTGYITNPKTIVAIGGIIGHYGAKLSNLPNFSIDLTKLDQGLKSTVRYLESSLEGNHAEVFLTPDKHTGEFRMNNRQWRLNVRRENIPTYPSRALYVIDFDHHKIANRLIEARRVMKLPPYSEMELKEAVREEIDGLMKKMPFRVTLSREADNYENLIIDSVIDRTGENEVSPNNLEVHIQSLGADERYWLDTGEFNF